jgi:solute carrier family 35 protein E3
MTKLAIIPFTVALQQLFYGKTFSVRVKLTLLLLLLGVAVATVNDVELNFLGTVVSAGAIVLTCVSQIWTGTMQKAHAISSTQLLHNAAPFMGLTLFVIGVPLDRILMTPAGELFTFSVPACAYIVLSCAIAISVNFSTFLVIGKCDAVTYQVLGHLKTVLILILGFLVLKNPANPRALAGIFVAMLGMVAYAHEESKAAAAPQAQLEKQNEKVLTALGVSADGKGQGDAAGEGAEDAAALKKGGLV